MSNAPTAIRIGLVSDTHAVYDQVSGIRPLARAVVRLPGPWVICVLQELNVILKGVQHILHAGDVGHKGSDPEGDSSWTWQRCCLYVLGKR